jgi:transcriptional regulator with XRE-family HTH domain
MVDEDNQRIGELIRQARSRRHLSQIQLAELLNTSQMMISDLEQGKRALKVTELPAFAKALDVPMSFLLPVVEDSEAEKMIEDGIEVLRTLPKSLLKVASEFLMSLSRLQKMRPRSLFYYGPVRIFIATQKKRAHEEGMLREFVVSSQISVEPYNRTSDGEVLE